MDFLVIHSGMPFVKDSESLRGHLYWAQVAGRDGEKASDQTTFVWSTMHKLYPRSRSEFSYGQNNSGYFLLEDIYGETKGKGAIESGGKEIDD